MATEEADRIVNFTQGMDVTPFVVYAEHWVNDKAQLVCKCQYRNDVQQLDVMNDYWFIFRGKRYELDGFSETSGFMVLLTGDYDGD